MNAKARKQTRDEMKDAIVLAASAHVAFDGWGEEALCRGATDAGFDGDTAKRLFPEGAVDAIEHMAKIADREMLARLSAMDLENMRVRDRVIAGVRARLEFLTPHRESVRRGLSILSRPHHGGRMINMTHNTVDAIWNAAGDRSSDFNWYTKRGLLGIVYAPTVLFWLADESEGFAATWDFLARRIDDVLKIPPMKAKAEARLESLLKGLPKTFSGFAPKSPDKERPA